MAGLAALMLSGCDTGDRPLFVDVGTTLFQGLTGRGQAVDLRPGLTREALRPVEGTAIVVYIEEREVSALMGELIATPNGRTFVTSDGISLTFETGFLKSTRGLGGDLMGADTLAVRQALGTTGQAVRVHDYLTGEDRIEQRRFTCTLSAPVREPVVIYEIQYQTARITESCSDERDSFTNDYWIDAQGVVRKSRQWLSPSVGYLEIERI